MDLGEGVLKVREPSLDRSSPSLCGSSPLIVIPPRYTLLQSPSQNPSRKECFFLRPVPKGKKERDDADTSFANAYSCILWKTNLEKVRALASLFFSKFLSKRCLFWTFFITFVDILGFPPHSSRPEKKKTVKPFFFARNSSIFCLFRKTSLVY